MCGGVYYLVGVVEYFLGFWCFMRGGSVFVVVRVGGVERVFE